MLLSDSRDLSIHHGKIHGTWSFVVHESGLKYDQRRPACIFQAPDTACRMQTRMEIDQKQNRVL
jgi:hypothetical protein